MTAKRKPVAPFYAVAALWLLGGLFLPLYSKTAIALLAVVSVAAFFAVGKLCQGTGAAVGTEKKRRRRPLKSPRRNPPPETPSWTR